MTDFADSTDLEPSLRYDAAPQRREIIINQLRDSGHVSISDISEKLNVSEMTVRRDLRRLASTGETVLVHGGASLPPTAHANPAFVARSRINGEAKRRIGRAAAAMISREDTVGIDAGTTALEVATALSADFAGCVVTHSVPVLSAMLSANLARTIAVGGELSQDNQALSGPSAALFISNLRLRIFMLGVTSVDERGVYVRSELELDVKRALLDAAEQVVLLCDTSKEKAIGTVRVCGLERIDTVVTDASLSQALTRRLHANDVSIVIA